MCHSVWPQEVFMLMCDVTPSANQSGGRMTHLQTNVTPPKEAKGRRKITQCEGVKSYTTKEC